ncbi:MAG: uracil-DNA glycosylase [Hyphomicrobiales bacterium]
MAQENASSPDQTLSPAEILRWQMDMGVDEALGDAPIDRFAQSRQKVAQQATPSAEKPAPSRVSRTPSFPAPAATPRAAPGDAGQDLALQDEIIADARTLAEQAKSLDEIYAALSTFDGCPLKKTAKNLVFSDGNPKARVMMIGEAPGADEDRQGKPFVGRSGQLLDLMLTAIGLDRHDEDPKKSVFISNTIFWRPPGNRKPTAAESEICFPFISRAIELVQPDILVCLGATPMHRFTSGSEGILRARGKWKSFESAGKQIDLLPTLHPAYLLRQPAQKRLSWRDFLALHEKLNG